MSSPESPERYVCAFRGRRDSYQVPHALAEVRRLDRLITDLYAYPSVQRLATLLPTPWDEKLLRRRSPGIPTNRVQCLWDTTAREWLRHALGMSKASTYAALDPVYSDAAAARARTARSHLLLYTPYAWEAFRASYDHTPRRILFQYHPHAAYERKILREDAERFDEFSFGDENQSETEVKVMHFRRRRIEDVWRHANQILCASTFTQRTLVEAGADSDDCTVVPYGVDLPSPPPDNSTCPSDFRVLFVGRGVQRKGLHHLLYAWQRANLPSDSRLTLVCRSIQPELAALANDTSRTTLRRGVPFETLLSLYREHTLFAMPSLTEGFGQVFLEAMSQGCPVLGTPNTCLPDVETDQGVVHTVEPGNVGALMSNLERLSSTLPGEKSQRTRARENAQHFTWSRFRSRIIDAT